MKFKTAVPPPGGNRAGSPRTGMRSIRAQSSASNSVSRVPCQPLTGGSAACQSRSDQPHGASREAEIAVMKGEPLGPLHGVPLSVKDVLPTRGLTTTGGSRLFADFVPEEDALAFGRLKAAGTVLLGKTNTSEFGHKAFTESPLFGVTRNPWDPTLTPGGSSGGGAAAVASGVGPIAL